MEYGVEMKDTQAREVQRMVSDARYGRYFLVRKESGKFTKKALAAFGQTEKPSREQLRHSSASRLGEIAEEPFALYWLRSDQDSPDRDSLVATIPMAKAYDEYLKAGVKGDFADFQNANEILTLKVISNKTRHEAEIMLAAIVGRAEALDVLMKNADELQDQKMTYGFNLSVQELAIRFGESCLKLLLHLERDGEETRGHSLSELWERVPSYAKGYLQGNHGRQLCFGDYDTGSFQRVRYPSEYMSDGKTIRFEPERIYEDSIEAMSLAIRWMSADGRMDVISVWPWSGKFRQELMNYRVMPTKDDKYDVKLDEPIEPMDWAGAIIETKEGQYFWTLYFGFTSGDGQKKSYELPSVVCAKWKINELALRSVEECVEQIHSEYSNPGIALQEAINQAYSEKGHSYQKR